MKTKLMRISAKENVGTSFKGYVVATYAELVEALGAPTRTDFDSKVTCEWTFRAVDIQLHGPVIVTVYDYKADFDFESYPDKKYQWHIGGNSKLTVAAFTSATGIHADS